MVGSGEGLWRERELGEGTTCERVQVLSWTVKGPWGHLAHMPPLGSCPGPCVTP